MAEWTTFAGITGVVLVLLLVLSHLTQSTFADGSPDSDGERGERDPAIGRAENDGAVDSERSDDSRTRVDLESESIGAGRTTDTTVDPDAGHEPRQRPRDNDRLRNGNDGLESDRRAEPRPRKRNEIDPESLSTGALLANVALSQGLFAVVLIGAVVYTGVPLEALGIELSAAYLETGLIVGVAAGLVLYVGNEVAAATATRFGFDHDEQLRELLAPESLRGWAVLLVGVLPIIAVFEELLFRAALIGAMSAGFGIDPWLLAVLSSIAFGIGHGMQGSVGIVVTGVLGFVLAAIFILTGSFLVVVVAHYLINALEFVVHEGLGLEWTETLEG
ncbi:CPBP family intramembrane glutamic endopeptidase [Halobiforma nitratireducens]|uniref:Abortive infection protein n=1 Tax=Halobiforma nitratireducens JCM 10879 TaxID=1227454 RepID=M0M7M5_9EURY|nr:type II CAAX endopeptidase family protein [Halobiforma nitratireducens]EMA41822.1 Abortive infection protein [Halobiforma nitratireducens JCM 10879]